MSYACGPHGWRHALNPCPHCPKPEAPTDATLPLRRMLKKAVDHYAPEPTKDSAREWTVAGFKEYLELHRRNYELDNLWGPDEKKCSDDFARFVELEKFFMPLDSKRAMIEAYEKLEREFAKATETNYALHQLSARQVREVNDDNDNKREQIIEFEKAYSKSLEALTAERAKSAALVEALEHYAKNFEGRAGDHWKGDIAREALAAYGKGERESGT